jgi:hypothetical protein
VCTDTAWVHAHENPGAQPSKLLIPQDIHHGSLPAF